MAKKEETKLDAPRSMTMAGAQPEQEKAIAQPPLEEYSGKWRNKKDGYLYKHCVKDHALGKTHKAIVDAQYEDREDESGKKVKTLIHTGLFWEGTPEEFESLFRRE